jgi:PKD repeat protein
MFPNFRSASQFVSSRLASAKRRPIRKQERHNRLSVLQLEDRVTPVGGNIFFNLSSATVQVGSSSAISLGSLTETRVPGGDLTSSAITISWGDGHSDHNETVSPITTGSTTYTLSDIHSYSTPGQYTVTVSDSHGASATTSVAVTPIVPASGIAFNVPPSSPAITVPVSTSPAGTSVSLGTFTDTNVSAGDLSNTSISIDWGDGSTTSGTAVATIPPSSTYYIFGGAGVGTSQVHNYANTGNYTVTVTVNDGVHSDSATITLKAITPASTNGITFNLASPSVGLTNSAAIVLGSVIDTNVASGSLASSMVTIDWGDGNSDTSATVTPLAAGSTTYAIADSHTYAATGSHTVTVTVNDGVHTASKTTTINVVTLPGFMVNFNLVSPQVPVNSTSTTDILGTFSDTFDSSGGTSATVNWGDGTPITTASLTALPNIPKSYTVALNHKYQTFGTFTATVSVTNGSGTFSATTPVTVYSKALSLTPLSVNGSPGTSSSLTAVLSDPGSTLGNSQYHTTVDWGDGTPGNPDVTLATITGSNGAYSISANHTYSAVGVYSVRLTATRAGSLPYSTISVSTAAHIARVITPSEWMHQLSDSLPLTDMSIPGTHQSAAGGSLLAVLTGDQDLLQKAQDADQRAVIADAAALLADTAALLAGELAPPLEFAAAALDAAAATLDGLAAEAWSNYASSLTDDAYPGLKDEATALAVFAGGSATLNGVSAGLHVASAIANLAAEGEAELNPIADAVQAAADSAAAGDDTAKILDRAAFYVGGIISAGGFIGGDLFDAALKKAQDKAAASQTQNLTVADQLNSGIRSLDVRGALVNDAIRINNGAQYTGVTLKDVLNAATVFLQAHPSETIVMTLRSNESAPVNSTSDFNTDLGTLLSSSDSAVTGTHSYNDFIYTSASPTSTPNLNQVRGKIVIIPYTPDSNSVQTGTAFGWQPIIVDETSTGVSDPVTIWNNAEGQGQTSGLIPTDLGSPTKLYINNLASESPGTPPIGVASGVNAFAEQLFGSVLLATNDANYFHVARTAGVVAMDDPGQTLISDIVAENNLPIVVTSDLDAGVGSLRAAIDQVNAQPGVNTIEFASAMTGPSLQLIALQADLPVVTNDVNIVGSIYIQANKHQVFKNAAQHTVTEIDFVASAGGITRTPLSPSPNIPLNVNVAGLTIFDHVAFTTAKQILTAGVASSPMILQLQDVKNAPVPVAAGAPPLTISLATDEIPTAFAHAEFRDSTGVSAPISSVNFTSGNSNAETFTYYDEKRGAPTVTALVGTLPIATQTEKVNANVPVQIYFYHQPASVYANKSIAPSVQMMDRFHNFVAFIPVTLTLNPVNVPAMRTGSKPVLRGTHSVKSPDNLNALASFSTASVNLPGVYTVTAMITVNGKKLSVTSNQFTIMANPKTVTTKVR